MDTLAIIKRIEVKLIETGMSKAEFYEKSGISSASYSQWNTGLYNPSKRKLESAAKCLGTTYEYLVNGIEKAPTPEDERKETLDKLATEIREQTRLLKNMVDSTYNFYLSLKTLAGGSMLIPREIAFMPEQSASIDAEIRNLIAKFLETATPEETSAFWLRYDKIGQEFRKRMENPAETPYPTPEEIEAYGEMAKNLVMQQFSSEEKPDASASSVKESDAV